MRIIDDKYFVEPGDSVETIRYLMQMGCKVYCVKPPYNCIRRLIHSTFGAKLSETEFLPLPKNIIDFELNYYINYDI